jgi:hypothetical protein
MNERCNSTVSQDLFISNLLSSLYMLVMMWMKWNRCGEVHPLAFSCTLLSSINPRYWYSPYVSKHIRLNLMTLIKLLRNTSLNYYIFQITFVIRWAYCIFFLHVPCNATLV